MKSLMLAIAASAALAAPARALLSAEDEKFVQGVKPKLQFAAVRAADAEGTITTTYRGDRKIFSLESLVKEGAQTAVFEFVTTREFIRKLSNRALWDRTPIPKPGYNGLYLTDAERSEVVPKIIGS